MITHLSSRYPSRDFSPSSLPIPLYLNPPKGVEASHEAQLFTNTYPDFILLVILNAESRFYVTTPETKPYLLLFALSITSSMLLNFKMLITGPNISSFAIVIWSSTSENMVVSTKYPFLSIFFPPHFSLAPS